MSFVYTTYLRVTFQKIISNLNFSCFLFLKSLGHIVFCIFQFYHVTSLALRLNSFFSKLVPIFFQVFLLLFLAQSLFDQKCRPDGFHFLLFNSSPFLSPESLIEMLNLTARPVNRYAFG